ncbi:hypothetical protein TYRP_019160 [Tyrophagus putrescentiae]|nr:hypothetical protein TYRP_019160 [Tyrophagus putrescentiae]
MDQFSEWTSHKTLLVFWLNLNLLVMMTTQKPIFRFGATSFLLYMKPRMTKIKRRSFTQTTCESSYEKPKVIYLN